MFKRARRTPEHPKSVGAHVLFPLLKPGEVDGNQVCTYLHPSHSLLGVSCEQVSSFLLPV